MVDQSVTNAVPKQGETTEPAGPLSIAQTAKAIVTPAKKRGLLGRGVRTSWRAVRYAMLAGVVTSGSTVALEAGYASYKAASSSAVGIKEFGNVWSIGFGQA